MQIYVNNNTRKKAPAICGRKGDAFMKITEKVSYIKGLAEGLSLDETSAQGKVISAIIDALEEMAKELSDLKEDTEYLDAYIEEIDEDLGMLEEDYYEDGGCDCDDEDCGCDDDFVEVECPECGETVCLDDSIDFDHVICPACGAEFSCVCDCCDDGDDNDECECGCGGKRGE